MALVSASFNAILSSIHFIYCTNGKLSAGYTDVELAHEKKLEKIADEATINKINRKALRQDNSITKKKI
jgi:hypothetical protein